MLEYNEQSIKMLQLNKVFTVIYYNIYIYVLINITFYYIYINNMHFKLITQFFFFITPNKSRFALQYIDKFVLISVRMMYGRMASYKIHYYEIQDLEFFGFFDWHLLDQLRLNYGN